MLNETNIRSILNKVVEPIARGLLAIKVTPNMMTAAGCLGVVLSAVFLVPQGHLIWAVVLITFFMLTDMLDGTMARISGNTGPWGALFDSTMDRIADAAVFLCLAVYFVRTEQWPMVWVASIILIGGMVVSYTKARAESVGLTTVTGIAERTERLVILGVAVLLNEFGVPYAMAIILWILAALVVFTALQRLRSAYLDAQSQARDEVAQQNPDDAEAGE